jgi:glycosyltransferase involved in cell wall biosynthesis
MFEDLRVAVVVPAHNEEALIDTTLSTMPALVDHVIVVDDASTDATAATARAVGDPRVEVLTLERNGGVGAAILAGHRRAIEIGADVAVVMAGDAQMDPAYLPALLEPIAEGGYQLSKANRFFDFGSYDGMPRSRVVGNVLVGFMAKAATGYWHLFDPLNGYTAVRTDALRRLPLDRVRRDYSFECDLLTYLNIIEAPGKDVPVPARYGDERSGIRMFRASRRLLWSMWRGFWRRMVWKYLLWSFSPVAIFLFAGLALVLWGIGFGIGITAATLGAPSASAATVLIAVGPLLVGVNLLIVAWVLDVLASPGSRLASPGDRTAGHRVHDPAGRARGEGHAQEQEPERERLLVSDPVGAQAPHEGGLAEPQPVHGQGNGRHHGGEQDDPGQGGGGNGEVERGDQEREDHDEERRRRDPDHRAPARGGRFATSFRERPREDAESRTRA